jgi:hypothetical protein
MADHPGDGANEHLPSADLSVPAHSSMPAHLSMEEIDADLDADGYDGQFRALEGGDIQCLACRQQFAAAATGADRVVRLEGASDPADQVMVLPLECPHCGHRGRLMLHYGPDASIEEADVLGDLQRSPAEGDARPSGAPRQS